MHQLRTPIGKPICRRIQIVTKWVQIGPISMICVKDCVVSYEDSDSGSKVYRQYHTLGPSDLQNRRQYHTLGPSTPKVPDSTTLWGPPILPHASVPAAGYPGSDARCHANALRQQRRQGLTQKPCARTGRKVSRKRPATATEARCHAKGKDSTGGKVSRKVRIT